MPSLFWLLTVAMLSGAVVRAQRGGNGRETCAQLIGCLEEAARQSAQCESSARAQPRFARLSQRALSQCGEDPLALRAEKHNAVAQRQLLLRNCTAGIQAAPSSTFCTSTRASASDPPRRCFAAARRCRRECLALKRGCLPAAICHEEYETHGLHDQIHGLNKRLLRTQLCLKEGRSNALRSQPLGVSLDLGPVSDDLPFHEELFED